jgi:hypothetical protein
MHTHRFVFSIKARTVVKVTITAYVTVFACRVLQTAAAPCIKELHESVFGDVTK